MHRLYRGLCVCGFALALASCAQDKKLPEGVRISVLDDAAAPVTAVESKAITIPQAHVNASWMQAGVNPNHIIGNIYMRKCNR